MQVAVEKGLIEFTWIDGKINPADGLPEPLERVKHRHFCNLIDMVLYKVDSVMAA